MEPMVMFGAGLVLYCGHIIFGEIIGELRLMKEELREEVRRRMPQVPPLLQPCPIRIHARALPHGHPHLCGR